MSDTPRMLYNPDGSTRPQTQQDIDLSRGITRLARLRAFLRASGYSDHLIEGIEVGDDVRVRRVTDEPG